jgi:hypothetical protein
MDAKNAASTRKDEAPTPCTVKVIKIVAVITTAPCGAEPWLKFWGTDASPGPFPRFVVHFD